MARETLFTNMSKHPFQVSSMTMAKDAFKMMEENDIRHLPVVDDGRLVGVVSDRDLKQVINYKDAENTTVWSLMSTRPYVVKDTEPVKNVIHEMIEQKYGCAVVVDQFDWVTGIFTTIDALELLEKLLAEPSPQKRTDFGTIEQYLVRNTQRPSALPPM